MSAGRDAVAHEVLESLGLEGVVPGPQALGDLFTRFQTQVRWEPGEVARDGERVLEDFLEEERGARGAERTLAFLLLARAAGLDARLVPAELLGAPHAAVLVTFGSGSALCDAAFPLPEPLALDAADVGSPYGRLSLEAEPASLALRVEGRGRSAVRAHYRVAETLAVEDCPRPAPGASCGVRLFPDRVLRWTGDLQEVLDPWSRLLYGGGRDGELSAYDRSALPAAALLSRLQDPAGLLALYPKGGVAEEVRESADGWEWTVTAEPAWRRERARREPDGLSVAVVEGELPFALKRYRVEPDGRLTLRATLSRPVPVRGLAEPVRKTLVFHLASELLQLSEP